MKLSFWARYFILKETDTTPEMAKELGYWSDEDDLTLQKIHELDAQLDEGVLTRQEYDLQMIRLK